MQFFFFFSFRFAPSRDYFTYDVHTHYYYFTLQDVETAFVSFLHFFSFISLFVSHLPSTFASSLVRPFHFVSFRFQTIKTDCTAGLSCSRVPLTISIGLLLYLYTNTDHSNATRHVWLGRIYFDCFVIATKWICLAICVFSLFLFSPIESNHVHVVCEHNSEWNVLHNVYFRQMALDYTQKV